MASRPKAARAGLGIRLSPRSETVRLVKLHSESNRANQIPLSTVVLLHLVADYNQTGWVGLIQLFRHGSIGRDDVGE